MSTVVRVSAAGRRSPRTHGLKAPTPVARRTADAVVIALSLLAGPSAVAMTVGSINPDAAGVAMLATAWAVTALTQPAGAR